MAEKHIRIGFLTFNNPYDKRSWSGIHYNIFRNLNSDSFEVIWLGPIRFINFIKKIGYYLNKLIFSIFKKNYFFDYGILISLYYSLFFNKRIKSLKIDIIFAPSSLPELAFIKSKKPVIIFHDCSILQLLNYYPLMKEPSRLTIKEIKYIEQRGFKKADIICLTSNWAIDFIADTYDISKEKFFLVPFGSNFEKTSSKEIVLSKKKEIKCRLLFIAVDWHRKGGLVAYEATRELKKMGIDVELIICGCEIPKNLNQEIIVHFPFLDKNKEKDAKLLEEIYLKTDFLILPTKADCTPIIFSEACAFGIPSFTSNTGGIGDCVIDKVNGYKLNINATGKDYASLISKVYSDEQLYYSLRYNSRKLFDEKFNWNMWGKKIDSIICKIDN